jgi:uncharacterized protein
MKKNILFLFFIFSVLAVRGQDSARFVSSSGLVLQQLRQAKYQEVVDKIDPEAKPRPDSARIGTGWRNLVNNAGPFQSVLDTTYLHQANYDVVVFQCMFAKRKMDIKTVYGRNKLLRGVLFLPTDEREKYSPPSYYKPEKIEEIPFEVVNGDVKLRGVLTLPKGASNVPVVILVHGSGPNDKDESVGATKIFRDFSYGLPPEGIAVLRYDKRTRALGALIMRTKPILTPEEETVSDAVAAIEAMKKDGRIDSNRIYLMGHSMGAYLLPRVIQRSGSIAGAVMLSPHAQPLNQLLIEQSEYVLKNDTAPNAEKQLMLDSLKRESVKVDGLKEKDKNDTAKVMGLHPAYWLYLRDYDAFTTAKSLRIPLLFIYGGRDYQVTAKEEAIWKTKMKGVALVTFKDYPGLNHFYVSGSGKSVPGEYLKAGNVKEELINDLLGWMNANLKSR